MYVDDPGVLALLGPCRTWVMRGDATGLSRADTDTSHTPSLLGEGGRLSLAVAIQWSSGRHDPPNLALC